MEVELNCQTIILIVLCIWTSKLSANSNLPLIGDEDDIQDRKTPGCRLGNSFYDLEETWNPVLEPDGMMVCIICQCLPLVKKGVLQTKGKVICRNVKDECPKPRCDNPVLLPDQCCKTCPGEGPPLFKSFIDPRTLIPPPSFFNRGSLYPVAHQTYSPQDFMALLVGRSKVSGTRTRSAAVVYFSLYHSSLSYTILYEKFRPSSVLFMNEKGHLLDDIAINASNIDSSEQKVCGTWYFLPSIYLKYLLNGDLYVALKDASKDAPYLGGKIIKYDKEMKGSMLSVLTPKKKSGGGAVAMISLSSRGKTLTFNVFSLGLLSKNDLRHKINVTFHRKNSMIVELPAAINDKDLALSGSWEGLNKRRWRQLSAGRTHFSLVTDSGTVATGSVIPHLSCNILQAVLSSRGVGLTSDKRAVATPLGAGASAIVRLRRDGSLLYSVAHAGLGLPVDRISIGVSSGRDGRIRKICKSQIKKDSQSRQSNIGGKIEGQCKRLHARYLTMLLEGQMFFSLRTSKSKTSVQGRIQEMIYDQLTSQNAVLLTGSGMNPSVASDVAGQVWMALDSLCSLHYQIVVDGFADPKNGSLKAVFVSGSKGSTWPIKEFVGTVTRGILNNLDGDVLKDLDSGDTYLKIESESQPSGKIAGQAHIPNNCHDPNRAMAPVPMDAPGDEDARDQDHRHDCFANGHWNKDGESWVPGIGHCQTCSCKRGDVICHDVICPPTTCQKPVNLPGECCPQCLENENDIDDKCFFTGDKRFHYVGTQWHPYVPPFGYVKCALCQCSSDEEEEVTCRRLPCPPLPCPSSVAYRATDADCCLTCPNAWDDEIEEPSQPLIEDIMLGDIDESQSCMFGQYKYQHGDEWNPRIAPFGKMDCITCRCEKGKTQCAREKCPRLKCKIRHLQKVPGACCPVCKTPRGKKLRKRSRGRNKNG